ncbi:hypothetical protein [Ferrimonas marina]|uniref:Lipoprotein n=1 Tax=Ferrimonas marina TaxID=299255 RepID=A0A1M5MKE7_9GAMM|nr:hypothetical protein [Ferrimonas marina]SHG77924.1 hypothetical protein SAMN02745129_0683 [Ferrimonas marina]
MKRALSIGLIVAGLAACTGGGETVISGIGNSGNRFGDESDLELLARAVARHDGTESVTDEELAKIFVTLKQQAIDGNAESALVVYRVAAIQRRKQAEAEGG